MAGAGAAFALVAIKGANANRRRLVRNGGVRGGQILNAPIMRHIKGAPSGIIKRGDLGAGRIGA